MTPIKAPLRNRIRFMCEKMGWLDRSIAARVDMPADEVRAFRRRHGIVHKSEQPEAVARAIELSRRAAERRKVRDDERRTIRDEMLRAERERQAAEKATAAALDRWALVLAGRQFEGDDPGDGGMMRMPRRDSSEGMGASSMSGWA